MPNERENERLTKDEIARLGKIYRRGRREFYRWRKIGLAKGIPCPLWEPKKMPEWWARCMSQSAPENILAAARDVGGKKPAADAASSHDRQLPSIDLTQFDLDEGQAVAQQRQLVAALYHQLSEAYKKQQPVDLLQAQYVKAAKALRELERDDREDRAHRGKYIARDIAERDATTAADMLRQMHGSMTRRVIEKCPFLSQKQRRDVSRVLDGVLADQAAVFQRINKIESPDDFLLPLAAA